MDHQLPISSLIHEIRGIKVMLDRDLAALYQVETKVLKQAVRRNLNRFPEDFAFELTDHEHKSLIINMKSQIVTSNKLGGNRYSPIAFTEQGIAMLSSVLRSETAIQINIRIMRAFVEARKLATIATEMGHELRELRARVDLIQMENEQTLGVVNDLSEDMRAEIAAINDAITELTAKVDNHSDATKPDPSNHKKIGFKSNNPIDK